MPPGLIITGLVLLLGAGGLGLLMFKSWRDQKTGADLEAGKISAVTAEVEAEAAQAAANVPTSQDGLVDRLKKGTLFDAS